MFGAKKERDADSPASTPRSSTDVDSLAIVPHPPGHISVQTNLSSDTGSKASPVSSRQPDDIGRSPEAGKKRRSSSAKAKEIFSNAKNSLLHGDKDGPQTPMQKLSKTDAALSVPQGSLNNSAGESHPTPRSSFQVGVTEDKNKKCRRTMEDTHAYLYNFLGTPAPVLPSGAGKTNSLKSKRSVEDKDSLRQIPSEVSQHVVETDNGYFAIFDGHAGTFAAEWCGKKLHILLEDLMRKNPNSPVPELLDQAYTSADSQLERLPLKNSGCTAITAVLRWEDRVPNNQSATGSTAVAAAAAAAIKATESENGDSQAQKDPSALNSTSESASLAIQRVQENATRQRVLYTANVGDARIVLCRNGKALRLSYDHKGNDENEGKRIAKAGGLILNNRVNGVLAVTRALGDSYLKDLVTGHPYTTETVIQPEQDEFLILACDGVGQSHRTHYSYHANCSLALGRVLRPRSGGPDSQYNRSPGSFKTTGRSCSCALLHRQSVGHDRAFRSQKAAVQHS
jgi:protein phosphatase PTC1